MHVTSHSQSFAHSQCTSRSLHTCPSFPFLPFPIVLSSISPLYEYNDMTMWVYNQSTPDPHSHTATVITISILFPALALIAIAFRFYVRLRLKRTPWFDDYAALSSAVLGAVYGAIAVARKPMSKLIRLTCRQRTNGMDRNKMGPRFKRIILPR